MQYSRAQGEHNALSLVADFSRMVGADSPEPDPEAAPAPPNFAEKPRTKKRRKRFRCLCRCTCHHKPWRLIPCYGCGHLIGPGCCAVHYQEGADSALCHECDKEA